ncbi:MAG: dehypoxanthine futalosine cyclase [Acidobacteriaceae bacterium]|jgi:cyclic dehypoxanthinyl futalosine synthase
MGISREQALDCFRSNDLVGIGMEADAVRRRLHPEGVVTYAIGCEVEAGSAASVDAICGVIGEAVEMGGTGVRVKAGAGREGMERFEGVVRGIRQRFPELWIEGVTAAEVRSLAADRGVGLREAIARLRDAGLDAIAGDGADLAGVGGAACGVAEWVEVQRAAHGVGMRTAAVMRFGAGETREQRVDFLEAVRALQQETGGFTASVPVAAEVASGRDLDAATAVERLKTLAIGRMFLDNVENVQAIRAGHGLKVLQTGLRFGANDAGVVSGEGASEEDVRRVIRDAGFRPAQRDAAYQAMMLS